MYTIQVLAAGIVATVMFGGTAGCLLYLKQAVVCVFDSCDYAKLEIGWADLERRRIQVSTYF